MQVESFTKILASDFYVGVPDSQLRSLCDYLYHTYGVDDKYHIIAANEGNAVGIAAGYHLATGKVPVVYMQNSGEGNAINPLASLMNEKVYGMPCIFVIGWRGEPGIHDEPQHIYQGEITLKLLEVMDVEYMVVGSETTEEEIAARMKEFKGLLDAGKDVAFVIRKGALSYDSKVPYENRYELKREEAIAKILEAAGDDLIVSTTGKASRELFEIRERNGQGHDRDFLTVGSMGHSSSIALGIAGQRPETRVWCIDGDGAALMHLGALAVIGSQKPSNLIHIVINNEAHESVGGMPTAAGSVDLCKIAEGCGYTFIKKVADKEALSAVLSEAKETEGPVFLEVDCAIGSRPDLGRPTTSPIDNKEDFMETLLTPPASYPQPLSSPVFDR